MTDEPAKPVAYCAPGRQAIAKLALLLHGQQVIEVREHPGVEGLDDVYVVTPSPAPIPALVMLDLEPPRSEFRRDLEWQWRVGALALIPPRSFTLGSIV
jgi:hypothetical protein